MPISDEELKQKVQEAVEKGDRETVQSLSADATPKQVYTIIIPAGAQRPEVRERLAGTSGTIKFVVEGEGGGAYWVKINPDGSMESGEGDIEAQTTVTQNIDDWRAIMRRELDPQMAFMQGKIKITGDMSLIMKLAQLMRPS